MPTKKNWKKGGGGGGGGARQGGGYVRRIEVFEVLKMQKKKVGGGGEEGLDVNKDLKLLCKMDFDKHCTPEKSTNFVQNQKKILSQ